MTDPTLLHAPAASAPGVRRALRLAWRISFGLALAAFTLLLAAWLALHSAILPHIDRWRPLIECETGKALGVMLRIGAIEAISGGWAPRVELRDVELLDAQQRPALRLARVVASVSTLSLATSLATLELRLAQLLIDGARLEGRRDAAGRIFVAGFELGGRVQDGSAATDWLLHQREIAIRGATCAGTTNSAVRRRWSSRASIWCCATRCAATRCSLTPRRRPSGAIDRVARDVLRVSKLLPGEGDDAKNSEATPNA